MKKMISEEPVAIVWQGLQIPSISASEQNDTANKISAGQIINRFAEDTR